MSIWKEEPVPKKVENETAQWVQRIQVVGYVRVSTPRQGMSRVGLELQGESIRGFVAAKKAILLDICQDVHTGVGHNSIRDREGLHRAIDLATSTDAYIVMDDWSRLTRHEASADEIAHLFPHPERLISIREGANFERACREGQLKRKEAEARMISRLTKQGMAARKEQGAVFGNPEIRSIQAQGTRAATEKADRIVRSIAELLDELAAEGKDMPPSRLIDLLNHRGLLTAQGNEWTCSRLRGPLKQARIMMDEKRRTIPETYADNPAFGRF